MEFTLELSALAAYASTLFALTLVPGPLVAVLAARAACRDQRGAFAMALGVCLGDIAVIVAICGGIGFWLKANPEIFDLARYAGFVFLIWIAMVTWRKSDVGVQSPIVTARSLPLVASGLALCLSSPQTLILYLVLLPKVADVTMIGLYEIVLVILATVVALLGVFLIVILLAGGVQNLLRAPRFAVAWARSMSVIIALSALWVLLAG